MFTDCNFLLGEGSSIIIVIPARLPKADTYTVSVSDKDIKFKAGYEDVAEMTYRGGEVFKRLVNNTQIGLVEYPPGSTFTPVITNVAYIEVRRAAA